jgi:hypothetical protein
LSLEDNCALVATHRPLGQHSLSFGYQLATNYGKIRTVECVSFDGKSRLPKLEVVEE